MISRPDFVVTAADGRPLAAVEAYALPVADPAAMRRHYLRTAPSARFSLFFLLVGKDRTFVWTCDRPDDASPDFCGDTRSALAPYVDERWIGFDDLRGPVFEMFVSSWLSALTRPDLPSDYLRAQPWLVRSGLHEMMRGAEVEMHGGSPSLSRAA